MFKFVLREEGEDFLDPDVTSSIEKCIKHWHGWYCGVVSVSVFCVLQELLQRLFQLFDHDRDNLLVQEDWVEFLKERLT
jgi:hypothetical protein